MAAVTLTLQILTLLVAAVGPFLAYHYARKLAVSSNRQAWIDALRDDVAHFIALKDNRMSLMRELAASTAADVDAEGRRALKGALIDKTVELQAARQRIRLRLRAGNEKHDRLISAVEALAQAKYQENRNPLRAEVVEAAGAVITYTWEKVEKGQ